MSDSLDELKRRKEKEELRTIKERQQAERELEKMRRRENKMNRQQKPPPPPAYKKKSPLVKYLGILVILVAVGLVGYFHRDDLSKYGKDIVATFGGLLPDMEGNDFFDCLLHPDRWSYCWAGTPPEQEINKYKVINVVLENGRMVKNPTRGEKYSVQVNVKNLLEDVTFDDVIILGRLDCKKKLSDEEEDWGLDRAEVELEPLDDSYQLTPSGINTILETDEVPCELESCQKLIVNVTYNYNNSLRTNFRFGTSKETAEIEEKDFVDQGPITMESDFGPYGNYYYPGEGYGGDDYLPNRLDLTITIVNKGEGEGILTGYTLEKKIDTFNLLNDVSECEFSGDEVKLDDRDDYETCRAIYSFNNREIEPLLSDSRPLYNTLEFVFDVDYEYTRSVRKSISLEEGNVCVDDEEDSTPTDGDGDSGDDSSDLPNIPTGYVYSCQGEFGIKPMSQFGWDHPEESKWCGVTSAAMLFNYYGNDVTPEEVYEYGCDCGNGYCYTWAGCVAKEYVGKYLTEKTLKSEKERYIEHLSYYVCAQEKPVIAKISSIAASSKAIIDHFVLVTGVTETDVIYNDPATGKEEVKSHSQFFNLAKRKRNYQIRYV